MYRQNSNLLPGYTSLNSSIVASPKQVHNRTQSYSKVSPSNPQTLTHARTPSQKKLTLTCQNIPPNDKCFKKENNGMLRKQGKGFPEKNNQFVSVGSSRVFEC